MTYASVEKPAFFKYKGKKNMQEITISVMAAGSAERTIEVETTTQQGEVDGIIYNLLDEGYTLDEIIVNKQSLYWHSETGNFQPETNVWVGDRPIGDETPSVFLEQAILS